MSAGSVTASGPGSECSAQVMVSDDEIAFPYIRRSDIFVALSQSAYEKFVGEMKEGAMLVHEGDLVTPDARLPKGVRTFGIPATCIADEEFRRRIVFNMIMIGFIAGATKVVGLDAVRRAVEDSVPQGTEALNLKAFDRGYQYAVENYG